jgi:hypothetical protein
MKMGELAALEAAAEAAEPEPPALAAREGAAKRGRTVICGDLW